MNKQCTRLLNHLSSGHTQHIVTSVQLWVPDLLRSCHTLSTQWRHISTGSFIWSELWTAFQTTQSQVQQTSLTCFQNHRRHRLKQNLEWLWIQLVMLCPTRWLLHRILNQLSITNPANTSRMFWQRVCTRSLLTPPKSFSSCRTSAPGKI